ncbi:DnaA N-terminal domain-containing protein [Clostridium sp. UBA1652]|uniref:DnaA N-terminal domain-containing protein n=1 Tax=Clostridium sp. UBA1652 TaxID=1946348 RepID=UPI00257FF40C|nr:DnaA N-terminal domain-containing protein [Clostridium sp. UBA1652]
MEGFIGLYRSLLDKPIWKQSTPEQKTILITILLMVNHKEAEWEWQGQKFSVKPGQTVTSLENIVLNCGKGVTTQNVRTALKRFEKLGFLTNESTKTGRLLSVVNWEVYQVEQKQTNKDTNKDLTKSQQRPNKDLTNDQQRPNKDLTPNKNDNNNNNDNNDKKIEEEPPILEPLSNLTQFEEAFLKQYGETSYRTWLEPCEVKDTVKEVLIVAPSDFTKSILESRYKDGMELLCKKKIEIKGSA